MGRHHENVLRGLRCDAVSPYSILGKLWQDRTNPSPHKRPLPMIDSITSLAFSMHSNKGVYALLLGSGISRAARIPTGWEITLDLVRKVAALQGANCEPDPAAWFTTATGKAPDYSELLDALAKTPPERQQLLRDYWEPTEQERQEGAKLPTRAHRAIAELVKRGYIRVILTTNFDRLLETALQDVGIQPTVLSSADHVAGALPLIHTSCTVVKLHGDYLDTRIRNTPDELAKYPKEFDALLDRVFDEFGLIVAGWSAEWDEALRAALTRAPSRRFTTYWAAKGKPGERAAQLIAQRQAQLIDIAGADEFFGSVAEKVRALEEYSRPHPLSTEAALAALKTYLSEPKYRIALDDLIRGEVSRARDIVTGPKFSVGNEKVTGDAMLARLRGYEAAMTTLLKLGFTAGRWSNAEQFKPWRSALVTLGLHRIASGSALLIAFRKYPAALLFYCLGIGAVVAENWALLRMLLEAPFSLEHGEEKRAVELLALWAMYEHEGQVMRILPDRKSQHTPLQGHVEELLLPMFREHFPNDEAFRLAFDRFEMLSALSWASTHDWAKDYHGYWAPPGSYAWRTSNRERIFKELEGELAVGGPLVQIIGRDRAHASQNVENLKKFVPQLRWW